MAITVEERWGRRLSDDSGELVYLVRGTFDAASARSALISQASSSFDGMSRDDAEVEEIKGVPNGAFIGRVTYSQSATQQQTNQSQFAFETRGQKEKITNSIATVSSHSADVSTPPDFQNAIGVTPDGEVKGTEITVPVYSFSETHHFSSISDAYKGTLFSLTGKTNDAAFKGLAAGEGLFLGAVGSKRGNDPWSIKFAFAGSPNMGNLSVGQITGIAKAGWEYLWTYYKTVEQSNPKMIVKRPFYAFVEQVYRAGDFSQLGIGT